jgi:2-polyprenyl-6-methoxyphenol hydroxylase-like FAD-dependent oxidoreductase
MDALLFLRVSSTSLRAVSSARRAYRHRLNVGADGRYSVRRAVIHQPPTITAAYRIAENEMNCLDGVRSGKC